MFYQLSGFREDDLTHFLINSPWQGSKESWKPVTLECPVPNVGRNGLRINVETDGRRTFGPGELKPTKYFVPIKPVNRFRSVKPRIPPDRNQHWVLGIIGSFNVVGPESNGGDFLLLKVSARLIMSAVGGLRKSLYNRNGTNFEYWMLIRNAHFGQRLT